MPITMFDMLVNCVMRIVFEPQAAFNLIFHNMAILIINYIFKIHDHFENNYNKS